MEFSGVRYSLCHDEKVEAVYEIDEDFWTMRRGCQPIALVIFDAFDTLITPRIPPHLQYVRVLGKVNGGGLVHFDC